jgi:starch synthase
LLTLHNVGYQGILGKELLEKASIEGKYFFPMGPAEYYGKVNFLKMGIFFADKLNTVSPTYAKEILQPEYGAGMEGVLREREKDLSGILNGVDYSEWNPATDKFIYKNYDENSLENKIVNKEYLLKEFKLNAEEDVPLIGMVSRLVHQKGFDLFTEALPRLMSLNAHWILLGSGWKEFEEKILSFSQKYSDKFKVVIGYDNKLAHRIEAAADIFLMPSRYEPCGLNQIYSLKYGTLPLVRRTGGLADTVKDFRLENPYLLKIANGFTFDEYSVNALYRAVERALKIYEEKDIWKRLQLNGMAEDFSWATAAGKYEKLYREMISG